MSHKIIFYEPAGRIHPSQWDMLNYPPLGYKFAVTASSLDGVVGNSFIFDKLRLQVIDRLMPLNLFKAWLDTALNKVPDDASMVFSYNHPIFRKIPWVVLVEWAHILVGRDLRYFNMCKPIIERAFKSDNCKGIIFWSDVAMQSVLQNFKVWNYLGKVAVIPPGIKSRNLTRDYDRGTVRILFVGSLDDPEDFVMKGGREVLRVFSKLLTKYKDIELVIRAKVPGEYARTILPSKNVRVIQDRLSQEGMDRLYKDADIFLHPSYKLQTTSVLTAMSYGLPVVTTNIGSTCGEYVKDGVHGFVVKDSRYAPFFTSDNILTSETIHRDKLIVDVDRRVVNSLVEKVGKLVLSPALRKMMGSAGAWEVDYGRLSIRHRNMLLKKLFDGAL